MDTGVTIYKIAPDTRRSDLEAATHEHNASVEAAEAVRRRAVDQSMADGYVLTEYFYDAFAAFEKQPQSFKESIGEMVYGMDVSQQLSRVKHITFNQQASSDVVHRSPRELRGLDLAEIQIRHVALDPNALPDLDHPVDDLDAWRLQQRLSPHRRRSGRSHPRAVHARHPLLAA